jgi:uncharacterized membrane protein YhaH (DUF805 family)
MAGLIDWCKKQGLQVLTSSLETVKKWNKYGGKSDRSEIIYFAIFCTSILSITYFILWNLIGSWSLAENVVGTMGFLVAIPSLPIVIRRFRDVRITPLVMLIPVVALVLLVVAEEIWKFDRSAMKFFEFGLIISFLLNVTALSLKSR